MKEKIKNKLGTVGITVFELIVGIFLFLDPEKLIKFVLAAFGIYLIALGIIRLFRYNRSKNKEAVVVGSKEDKADKSSTPGILHIIFGVICCFGYPIIKGIFSALAFIIGIVLILAGIVKYIQYNDDKKRGSASSLLLTTSVLSLVCGVLCIINPFGTTNMLFRFAAVAMIAFSCMDLAAMFGFGKKEEKEKKS